MDLIFKLIPMLSTYGGLLVFVILIFFFSCWVKISTVFGILRLSFGFSGLPSILALSGLSLALTAFVMFPTMQGLSNLIEEKFKLYNVSNFEDLKGEQKEDLLNAVSTSWLNFLQKNTSQNELERFAGLAMELSNLKEPNSELMLSWRVVAPAFIISELKKAFSIAFSLFLPFLVIDLVVATVLAAVELNNLEAQVISLPFKLLLFVLIDGWGLIASNLVKSYIN